MKKKIDFETYMNNLQKLKKTNPKRWEAVMFGSNKKEKWIKVKNQFARFSE